LGSKRVKDDGEVIIGRFLYNTPIGVEPEKFFREWTSGFSAVI
jgi:hypothetical protein